MPAKKRKATKKKTTTVSHVRYKKVVKERNLLKKHLKKAKADLLKVKKGKCKTACKTSCKTHKPSKKRSVKKHVALRNTHTRRQTQRKRS